MSGSGVREFPRHKLVKRVKVNCASWDAAAQLYTQNISRGGMFVRTPQPPQVGSQVEVLVTLPDGAQSPLVGEVVRVVTAEEAARTGGVAGMGLRFGQLGPQDIERLERLIELARHDDDEPLAPDSAPAAAAPRAPPPPVAAPAPAPIPAAPAPVPSVPLDVGSLFGDLDAPSPSMIAPNPLQGLPRPAAPAQEDGSSSISQVLNIESAQAYMKASEAYSSGQYAEARMVAGSAVRSDPRNRELRVLYLLAYARELLASDRRSEAISQLQAVLKLDYKNQDAIGLLRGLGHA